MDKWVNRDTGHVRQIGRFYATDIWKVKKNYLTPNNFFDKKKIEGDGIGNVLQGIAGEDLLTRMFKDVQIDFTPQAHFELKIGEIIVSGRPDFKLKDKLLEVKAPVNPLTSFPERYSDQCECYYRAFNLPVYLVEILFNPFRLHLWPYEPSKKRWEESQKVLKEFHRGLLLRELQPKRKERNRGDSSAERHETKTS